MRKLLLSTAAIALLSTAAMAQPDDTVTGTVVSVQPGGQDTGCFKWTVRFPDQSEAYIGVLNGSSGYEGIVSTVNGAFGQNIRLKVGTAGLASCNGGQLVGAPVQATNISRTIP